MYVYLVGTIEDQPKYKIGRSKNPESRIKQLQTANGAPLELLNIFKSKYPTILESQLHKHFRSRNYINEWFALNEDDIKNFTEICARFETTFKTMETNPFWCKTYGLNLNS
jgi:hypothetical protein